MITDIKIGNGTFCFIDHLAWLTLGLSVISDVIKSTSLRL
jgi:hypothetical protein